MGKGAALKRWIIKIGYGFSRLAFWRKPVEANLESSEPESVHQSTPPVEAESGTATDDSARLGIWFARLKQALKRNRIPDPEPPSRSDISAVAEHSSRQEVKAGAMVNEAPLPKPSWLARLKGTFRRNSTVEQLEPVEDTLTLRPEKASVTTAPGHDDTGADEDAIPVSGIRRMFAVLLSKRVWLPGVSVMLIAIIATMTGMLLHTSQDKKQLQVELLAAQQKLKQVNMVKKVALGPVAAHAAHAAEPSQAVASADESPVESTSGAGSGDCNISNPENVAENLKNCINSFNAMSN
jgi:hypothetical protein